ncbi:hypothetical protein VNO77_03098 [Canavalia gladiata]|uniref:Uncharacterized protein n=1 Tax=Canavalia gladiata TaxID=3824 RepID=A0AAN9RBW9_CANGL
MQSWGFEGLRAGWVFCMAPIWLEGSTAIRLQGRLGGLVGTLNGSNMARGAPQLSGFKDGSVAYELGWLRKLGGITTWSTRDVASGRHMGCTWLESVFLKL